MNYIIYIPDLTPEDEQQFATVLHDNFGKNNVHHIGTSAYAVKSAESDPEKLAKAIGFADYKKIGFITSAPSIAGNYYPDLWKFLKNSQTPPPQEMPHANAAG